MGGRPGRQRSDLVFCTGSIANCGFHQGPADRFWRGIVERCALAILSRQHQVLLGRRALCQSFYPDTWDLIGGHCEGSETPEETLVRELQEEIGITPTDFRKIGILKEPNLEIYEPREHHVYLVLRWSGSPRNKQPQEHSKIQWFRTEEAERLELAHPSYPTLFKKIRQDTH